MARPKSKTERKAIGTSIRVELLEKLKEASESEGIPINRLIEISLEKYLDRTKVGIK